MLANAHVKRAYLGEADDVLSDDDDVTVAAHNSAPAGKVA